MPAFPYTVESAEFVAEMIAVLLVAVAFGVKGMKFRWRRSGRITMRVAFVVIIATLSINVTIATTREAPGGWVLFVAPWSAAMSLGVLMGFILLMAFQIINATPAKPRHGKDRNRKRLNK